MATVTKKQFRTRQFGGASPYGNNTTLRYSFATLSTGAADDSDSTSALAISDVLDIGPLPEGMRLDDAQIIITTGMTASVTASLGFKYEDGVDDAGVPQDAAYFGSGLAMATAARVRAAGVKLLTLPKPARLILTFAGANNAKVSVVDVLVHGVLTGPQ